MNVTTLQIEQTMNKLNIPLNVRNDIVSIAMARALAYGLSLPSEPVENVYLYYVTNLQAAVETTVVQLNENFIINIDLVKDLIKSFWVFRYRLVHDSLNDSISQFMDSVIKTGTREVPPFVSELILRYTNDEMLKSVVKTFSSFIQQT